MSEFLLEPSTETPRDDASISRTELLSKRICLHLGSGRKYRADAVNVDVTLATKPDVVHDLNQRPWPFPEKRFARVVAHDVLEHLQDTVAVLEEIHRVCRDQAVVELIVPHFSANGAYADPTHRRFFSLETFDYFVEGHPLSFYTESKFRVLARRLVFRPTLVNKIVWRLAHRWPLKYERHWAWIFPAYFIFVQLEVQKRSS